MSRREEILFNTREVLSRAGVLSDKEYTAIGNRIMRVGEGKKLNINNEKQFSY